MANLDIECIIAYCSPVNIMGTVETASYKGNNHYGMACAPCVLQVALEKESKIKFGVPGGLTAGVDVDVEVYLSIADFEDVLQGRNDVSTVEVSISGGTATGKTIDGGAGPVTVTFNKGHGSVVIRGTSAGTIDLALATPTHPHVTLDVTDTSTVTLA